MVVGKLRGCLRPIEVVVLQLSDFEEVVLAKECVKRALEVVELLFTFVALREVAHPIGMTSELWLFASTLR